MKKLSKYLVLLFVIFTFSSFLSKKGNKSEYKLTIFEANIPLMKDTVFGGNQCLITRCPVTLTNNTNDTLKYAGMSASWWDYYELNNKNFSLAKDYWNVFKNGQVTYILLPHQSMTKNIGIITYKDYFRSEKLRIAMRLQKLIKLPMVGSVLAIDSDSDFLIWSNEVTIR